MNLKIKTVGPDVESIAGCRKSRPSLARGYRADKAAVRKRLRRAREKRERRSQRSGQGCSKKVPRLRSSQAGLQLPAEHPLRHLLGARLPNSCGDPASSQSLELQPLRSCFAHNYSSRSCLKKPLRIGPTALPLLARRELVGRKGLEELKSTLRDSTRETGESFALGDHDASYA